jgi:hypothetical protein
MRARWWPSSTKIEVRQFVAVYAWRWVALAAVVALGGCADDALKGVGEPCISSAECAAGLLCDFGPRTPVCAPSGTVRRDMAVPVMRDAAAIDLNAAD